MDKDINCLNFKGLFGYIENRLGRAALDKLVAGALNSQGYEIQNKNDPSLLEPVTLGHLRDEAYWISNELSLSLLSMIKEVVPGPRPEERAGKGAVLEALSGRDLFFARLLGPRVMARQVAAINRRFNRTKEVRLASLTQTRASLRLDYRPGFRVTKEVCNWNLGIYKGIAMLSGGRNVRAREVRCVLDGHGHCEFEVDWQRPSLWSRVAGSVLGYFARDLVADYEKAVMDRDHLIESLRESDALFNLITGHTSVLVSIHDHNGDYLFASPSHHSLGVAPQSLVGQSGFALMAPEDAAQLAAKLAKAQEGELAKAVLPFRLRDKEGRYHDFRGSFDAVFDGQGRLKRIVCVGEEVTALRKAQAQREHAIAMAAENRKLALVGQVAGKMAHDFNNILGIIMGVSELALEDCRDDQIRDHLGLILDQTQRGRNLTRNLVAFAKPQEPRQEFFSINGKIDLVLNLMRKDLAGIAVSLDLPSDLPDLLADSGMIEHALVNLIQNAVHALGRTPEPRLAIRTWCQDRQVCLEIEDNGCGIPEAFLDRIYEPSFTLKGSRDLTGAYDKEIKGTGYGMANVRKYIEQHKGTISVWSRAGDGTRFTLCLPVIEKRLSPEDQEVLLSSPVRTGRVILLVEDEKVIGDIQSRVLTGPPCGHQVDLVPSGEAALALLEKKVYDLACLDFILKGKMTGMDLYTAIRSTQPSLPVLFVSGNLEFLESVQGLKEKDPCLDHLSKPCRHVEFIEALNRLLPEDRNLAAPLT